MLYGKLQMAVRLLTCALMLLAVAIQQSGRIAGHNFVHSDAESDSAVLFGTQDTFVIKTRAIATDIKGYGGDVPLKITVSNEKVSRIESQRKAETPAFFSEMQERLLQQYIGMTPEEVLQSQLDAVSGATLFSRAAMETMKHGMEYTVNRQVPAKNAIDWSVLCSARFVISFCVVLIGGRRLPVCQEHGLQNHSTGAECACPGLLERDVPLLFLDCQLPGKRPEPALFRHTAAPARHRLRLPVFRTEKPLLHVAVPVGFASGAGRELHEAQIRIIARNAEIPRPVPRRAVGLLMLLMWSGVCLEWMGYEPFSAFLFTKASWIVIVIALVSAALSFVETRPYCRFVCPTGNLFRITQNPR